MSAQVVMKVDIARVMSVIELLRASHPVDQPANVELDFGTDGNEAEQMANKLCAGLASIAMTEGLWAVFTTGMIIQRELERQAAFEHEMEVRFGSNDE